MKTNQTLNHISLLSFSFVAIIVLVNLFTTNNYGRANKEVVDILQNNDYLFGYHQLKNLSASNSEPYILVDLRTNEDFMSGHLPGAVNVPFNQLLDRAGLGVLKKNNEKIPVLYAEKESIAHTARLLLIAKGLDDNIMVLGGDYETALQYAIEAFDPAYANYKEEKARFDFKRFMQAGPTEVRSSAPAGIIPAVKGESVGAQGGC